MHDRTVGVCALGSRKRMDDELPHGPEILALAMPCEHCGHGGCYPGLNCQLCIHDILIARLTQRIELLEAGRGQ